MLGVLAVGLTGVSTPGCSETAPPELRPADPCLRGDVEPPTAPVKPFTPRWAYEPWISKDISDRADTYAYVDGFRNRGIPVGAVVLDSPWETQYNDFVPNPARYGDFASLVKDMHDRGVRVVNWMTQMVNEQSFDFEVNGDRYDGPSPNLEEGRACNYFIDKGDVYGWWKGLGAGVDFFNPHARAWWHRQQDSVLAAGLDGWKLDFGDSYVKSDPVQTAEGPKAHQLYSEKYYEDFLAYGRSKRGPDFVTMVRAWDESYEFPGRFFAKREHAPVAWMGDNTRDYPGLIDALDHMFVSAAAGYIAVGSDIGGYLERDDKNLLGPVIPFDTLNFARWTAVGALSPFMQLHGRGNIAPWTMPDHADETVDLYRYWATFHHALVPFFYSLSQKAYAEAAASPGGATPPRPIMRPIGDKATWKGDYRYALGDAFFVAPLLDATGKRNVLVRDDGPISGSGAGGASARFYDWWTTDVVTSGVTVAADYSSSRLAIPLWVREGAIVPMDIENDAIALGSAESKGARTLLVYPSSSPTTFDVHEADGSVLTVGQSLVTTAGGGCTITLSAVKVPVILRVRVEGAPTEVRGESVTSTYDAARKTSIIRVAPRATSATITVIDR